MKLNLGCSDNLLAGYVNVDIVPPANEIVDLRKEWPWQDNSVDEILALDIFEHLPDPIHTMNECWRVLKPRARVRIVVPTSEGRGWCQDPNHKVHPPFNRNSFFYYTNGDAHRERFGVAYGIQARFNVVGESQAMLADFVHKLDITLEAVK